MYMNLCAHERCSSINLILKFNERPVVNVRITYSNFAYKLVKVKNKTDFRALPEQISSFGDYPGNMHIS